MIKNLSKLLFLVFFISANFAQAQTKELTKQQILQRDVESIIQPIPRFVDWVDGNHFVMAKPNAEGSGRIFVLVDARTGEEQPYERPENNEAEVEVSNGDIFYSRSDETRRLTETEAEENNPVLSPDETKVAFTREHDLYVIDIESGEETRITNDGSDVIYNGWSSWVYMEEILGRSTQYKAFWWSPDSKKIAFMRFNDTPVRIFTIRGVHGSYGETVKQRYPKAGTENPYVKIGVYNLVDDNIIWADYNSKKDQLFGRPYWRPDSHALWTQWMNRDQDHLIIHEINLEDGSKEVIYEERQETWIDLDSGGRLTFLENGNGFLLLSDKSGWLHIYHYDMEGNLINQITSGEWQVTDIDKIDEEEGIVYFTARKENSARFDLYKVNFDGSDMQRLTFGEFTHSTDISPTGEYFTTRYSNVSTPPRLHLMNNEGEKVKLLGNSKGPEYDEYNLAETEILRIETPDGFALPVEITWPANIDESKEYPVLISIYGGPGSSSVRDRYSFGMNQYWAKEGLIQITIDHRGSGHFGKAGKDYMHRNLGYWEIKDYSYVMNQLIDEYGFIDEDRIGITGFSYGGYVTALALTKGAPLFDFGLAGGSVTDWHLYDTVYTERYMDTPQSNPEGYETSSVMNYVDNYQGGLLIVHGSMDDNVHMQNSLRLVSALEAAGKDFTFIPYIGGKHGWYNLRGKFLHYRNERYEFYYKHLIEKPMPEMLAGN